MGQDMDDFLKVGIISSMHGVHGEVKVFPTTDDLKRFKKLKRVFFLTKEGYKEEKCVGAKFAKNMVILKFEGYDNPNDIEKFRGCELYVDRSDAVRLEKDEYFIADLIDCKVVSDDGRLEGIVTDVLQTGANDVYEVKLLDGREILLPAIKECVLDVNMSDRIITIKVMDGLLED